MKLTRAQRSALERALNHLQRARAYIERPDIAVAAKATDPVKASTTLHYTRADGCSLYELNKDIGSDLTGLEAAAETILQMLALDAEGRRTTA